MSTKRFQVALSFPGEQRAYVAQVANALAERLGREQVFYDEWYTAELARPNLNKYLQDLYHQQAELIVPFLCADYERKEWCGLELRAILDLLKQRQDQAIMPLRFDDSSVDGFLSIDGYIDLRQYTPEQTAAFILQRITPREQTTPNTAIIHSDRLPTVKGGFFGRSAELQLLNDAWANTTTRIIQFIASGGTGKTKLLRHWIDHTADIPVLIAWSFYSQGSSEDKQTSATPFFSHVFEKLGSTRERFASEEDKGDHLAELLRDKRYVLVLDGLEPLQHSGAVMRGELKDKAIRQLLRQLVRHPCGLCIITTRIAVHELTDRAHVISHDLQNLAPADGVRLLQSLGVKGPPAELHKAVREYGCHALALNLLGNVLRLRHQGDVRKRDTLTALVKATGNRDSRHAFKVMQAYAEWFAGEPELALLHLLGLFDHPIGQDVLQMLWDAQIPHLTAGINEDEWLEAISSLREEHHLLSQHDGSPDLDCHPLIREYFGGQLQTHQPQAWQQAHERLYDYYKALPEKELPDTLEEMQPLFSAVAHGCAAGQQQRAFSEVYYPRIRQGKNHYLQNVGAFSDDLAVLAHFFSTAWSKPNDSLNEYCQASILRSVGHRLRSLGRIRESIPPFKKALGIYKKLGNNKEIAIASTNLIEPYLTLGEIQKALKMAEAEIINVKSDEKPDRQLYRVYVYARALHQAGKKQNAQYFFIEAEKLQQQNNPVITYLAKLPGFLYSEFLLEDKSLLENAMNRAKESLAVAKAEHSHLFIGLSQLIIGRIHLCYHKNNEAKRWVNDALFSLRKANDLDHLPRGLLARAELYRYEKQFDKAHKDLEEVLEIARYNGMRLHLTDYHLVMARVLLAEEKLAEAQEQVANAAKLITATGYKRRLPELEALQQQLA